MRTLVLLATTVLLAACVHDTDDTRLFIAEQGASLTLNIGDPAREKNEDPWNSIRDGFSGEPLDGAKTGDDDPWDSIHDAFAAGWRGGRKSLEEPTSEIGEEVWGHDSGSAIVRIAGETYEKSAVVFVTFDGKPGGGGWGRVVEDRGEVLRLVFANGITQYVINAPASWIVGTEIETNFYEADVKKGEWLMGIRVWRVVYGVPAGESEVFAPTIVHASAPENDLNAKERRDRGVYIVVRDENGHAIPDTVDGELIWPDPWHLIE